MQCDRNKESLRNKLRQRGIWTVLGLTRARAHPLISNTNDQHEYSVKFQAIVRLKQKKKHAQFIMAADHMPQIYRPRSNAYPPFRYSNILALIKKKKSRNNTHRKYFQIKRKRGGNLRKNKIKNNEETTSCGSGAESRVRRKIKEHTPIIGNKSLKTQNCTK